MGLVGWLLSLRPGYTEPAEVHQLVAESSGRWVAARLAGDRVRVWDGEGRPIWSGVLPGLGLWPGGEGRWLELGDGSALDLEAAGGPARVEGRGLRVWAGQRALIFTPGHIQAEGHTPLEAGPCDPSPDLRALPGPGGRVALVDLAWEGPLVWTPDAVQRGEGGPVGSACWVADRLYGVQGGVLRAWDADLSPLEPRRPHGLQTLAVAAGPPGPVTLGLGARGLELAWPGQAPIPLPGRAPERPALVCGADGVWLSVWSGVLALGWDGRERARLELPRLRRGRRNLSAQPELVGLEGGRLLVGGRPPLLVDGALRCLARLE